jgi:hypothetical protein
MPASTPEPGPDEPTPDTGNDLPAWPLESGPGWAWVEGSADTGPLPGCDRPGPQPEPPTADGLPADLDYAALVEALAASGALSSDSQDQDAELAELRAAEEEGRLERADPAAVAAAAVEFMEPGAAQAGWLEVAAGAVDRLDENALAGVAIAARQLASRAQAAELAAVAQITARAAAADSKIGVEADGRPVRLCRDAIGQVSLALMMTDFSAASWADLAITLTWRLPATGRALASGRIDLDRARLIAASTSVLTERQARAVEEQILPRAAMMTRPYLLERLSRAVIAVDPEGAEKRREAAERNADVRLYPDDDQTATITGSKLPQIHAAAGFARLTALARARKAAGVPGTLGFHRAQVMIGMLLDTLPYIPPADGAPPDEPPPDTGPGHEPGPAGPSPSDHNEGGEVPAPRDEDAPPDDGLNDPAPGRDASQDWDPAEQDDDLDGTRPVPAWPTLGGIPPALARRPAGVPDGRPVPGLLDLLLPWSTLAGFADRPGALGRIGPITAVQARLLAQSAQADPAAQWRVIVTNAAGQAFAVSRIRRPRRDPATSESGLASSGGTPELPGAGLVGRVTVTITEETLRVCGPPNRSGPRAGAGPPGGSRPTARQGLPPPIVSAALRAAARALHRAVVRAAADHAAGGCAHLDESPAYRPPPRLRDRVVARDVTCRNPVCRQPAWRADLDHTRPFDQQGRTCSCNLGGACRKDHGLKQHRRWKLEQSRPGLFTWTTPAGRTYAADPDTYPV